MVLPYAGHGFLAGDYRAFRQARGGRASPDEADDQLMASNGQATWRLDLDALAFRPEGHSGTCVVHRLAFRTLMRHVPTPDGCLAYFTAHEHAFRASARAKINRRAVPSGTNFHLTSRDLARALAVAK